MDNDLKRTIIIENYSNPFNKGLVNDNSYIKINVNNESCIDNIDMMIKIEDNIIKDIRFDGEACAITTSSTSIMLKNIIGKSIEEVNYFTSQFMNMINEEEYDASILKEAIVYDEIYKQENRKNCALLPYKALLKIINKK